ncbi:nucleolar protein 14 isoform X2 [Carica papaya]|nr:nucleolar protein 14 isoform X2 [Carica papaya]
MRSQRERQLKLGKKNKYNLSDGEEEDFEGVGLGDRDDFDASVLSDDDIDEDSEAAKTSMSSVLRQLNAHGSQNSLETGFEGEENKQKTKKEVMEEIIMKSKLGKMEKAKKKEENEQLMDELDKSFTSLVQSKVLLSLTEPGKMSALKALVNKVTPNEDVKKDELPVTQRTENFKQEQPDSYDKLVREMALDMRARPSDRTKTPEEIAQEERERLEKLEEERKKRMHAPDDFSDEDDENIEKQSAQKPRIISGDDLGDSFTLEEETGTKKGWVDEILERDVENSESEDDDGSSDNSRSSDGDGENEGSEDSADEQERTFSLKDWEQSDDDDDVGTKLEDEEEEEDHDDDNADEEEKDLEPRVHKRLKTNDAAETGKEAVKSLGERDKKKINEHPTDIPFLIDAPKSLEELYALIENCSNANVILVINRIRVSNAIKLAAENRKKMQVFYGVLLQYFAVSANKMPLNFELLNLLVKPLMEMSMEIPYFAAICARQRLLLTRTQFCEAIKNPDNGCWPSLKTLFLLRLWSMIFPCSDFRHVVMTPAITLMCEYLMRCPILSGRDIAIGSFLCSMLLSITKQSKKFCPEAILFLRTLLMAATNRKAASNQESEFYHLMELRALRPLLCIHGHVDDISPLNFLVVMDMSEDSPFFSSDNFRASMLLTVIETLRGFAETYEGLSSFPEIFLPISTLLLEVTQQENMPQTLQVKLKDVAQLIEKKAGEHHMLRQPLQMRKQKPVPIKLVNPKFEENFVKGRDYDPDRERAEARKLKKLIKKEAKGAARELRKDNYFLYEVKEREKSKHEEERAEKYGKALAFLQEQEHGFKSGQLGKGRKRRK